MAGSKPASIGLILGLSIAMAGFSACSTSHQTTGSNRQVGQSEVREVPVPSSGSSANQAAWEQGKVPRELQQMPSASSKPPVPGESTYTSTTAPTGETRTMPEQQASSTATNNPGRGASSRSNTTPNTSQDNE